MSGRRLFPPPSASKRPEVPLVNGVPLNRSKPVIEDRRLPNPPSSSSSALRLVPVSLLEDRIIAQSREIKSLLLDNQHLAADHVALKKELAATQQELRILSSTAAKVKAESDAEVREVYERSLKMDAEVRAIDAMSAELVQVRTDLRKLNASRQDLAAQLRAIEDDLAKSRSEAQQATLIREDIEGVLREIQRGRTAIEYEKKTCASNLEQSQIMDRNMITLAREIEKLRGELANAEIRARTGATAVENPGPGYHATSHGNPDMGYGGMESADPYGMHQIQCKADHLRYASGTMLHHEVQQ